MHLSDAQAAGGAQRYPNRGVLLLRFPANMLPVVFTAMVQVVVATAQIEKWAGTITYPPFATNEVLNITMNADANTATIAVD